MAETYEISIQSSDDDISLTAAEEVGLLSRTHQRTSSVDVLVSYTKTTVRNTLRDLDFLQNGLTIALLAVLWHTFSLAISVYNKWMFSGDVISFPFPLFMTSLHQAVQFTLSALLLYLVPSFRPQHATLQSSAVLPGAEIHHTRSSLKRFYLFHLIPAGVATALDMGLGNMSLRFSSLTFITVCKSSVLVFILLFAFLFRLERLSVKLFIIIAAMTLGEVMMVLGEVTFSMTGFTLVTSSAFFSGFRWALSQLLILKHPATSNPISMLFHLTPVVFVSLLSFSFSFESPTEILAALRTLSGTYGTWTALSLLLLPGCLAFCMVLSQFALLQRSSVVTLSVCGILKEVVIIGVAGVVFGDQLTPINSCGLFAILASVVAYNYFKISAARHAARLAAPQDVEKKYVNEKYS